MQLGNIQEVTQEQVKPNAVAFVFMRHVYNPPEDGFKEPTKNEWLRVPVVYKQVNESLYSIVFPHHHIRKTCDAIITDDGRIHKFYMMPEHYKNKKVSSKVIEKLNELAWDTTKTRCEDCPEYPWATILDPELIEVRIIEAYGDANRMNKFFKSSDGIPYQEDFRTIQTMVMHEFNDM